jgi:hypothetical protein
MGKRRWKDRKEGRYIRTLDPYHKFPPFIMKQKNDASNYFSDSIEMTEIDRYFRKRRVEDGLPGLGMLHLFTTAYLRMVSRYPAMNRFVSGQRVYARNNVELVMTIKSAMTIDAPETSIKVALDVRDTVSDVYRKINEHVERVKNAESTNTDDVAGVLIKLPRLLLKFVMFMLEVLDYFGIMPKTVLDASPFHGSIIITDLGSIGLPPVFHHLYNFGNLPLFIALGAKRKVYETQADGRVAERKYLDFTLVSDERVSDGFYFSQVYRYFKSLLRDPTQLDVPPEVVVPDQE